MIRRLLPLLLVFAPVRCQVTKAPDEKAAGFAAPEQLLVDKQTDFVAIVKVKSVENRWVILHDGDHFPLLVSESEMEETLSGGAAWAVGASQPVAQFDYTELITEPISPPAITGRRYVLWGGASPKESEIPVITPWIAHPQGLLLIRKDGAREFVYWQGKAYLLATLREAIKVGNQIPLEQIVDPVRRLKVARERHRKGELGDEKAFVQGLLLNVLDPEGQARNIERPVVEPSPDALGTSRTTASPHELWYESLALLRDVGRDDEKRRPAVVAALTPLAKDRRPRVRLAVSLALVDLNDDAGRDALLQGFEKESGDVSSDDDDKTTFPGRYPYDHSSVTACAHALARLGDRRGFKHPNPAVQLATAQALEDKPGPEVEGVLRQLASEGDKEVEKLKRSGVLSGPRARGDHTGRYPTNWVHARSLLARFGDDVSLRLLVEAYVADQRTYPKHETSLVPRGEMMSWGGASVAAGIRDGDATTSHLLARLAALYEQDPRWNQEALRGLREWLARPESEEARPSIPAPSEAVIRKRLRDADPNRRAEAWAAAGFHKLDGLYDNVLDAALNGKGVERNAAIYGLGFYERQAPEPVLRKLASDDDFQIRSAAVELATRKEPDRFATEVLDLLRAAVRQAESAGANDWEQRRNLAYMPRLLCRQARGKLPPAVLDGLKDPEPQVRQAVAEALMLAGNPAAVASLETARSDSNADVRRAVESALRVIGPADRP